jgi:hypothetical protein
MKNKFLTYLASMFLLVSISTLKAEVNVGASVIFGQLDTSGSETEITDIPGVADVNSKSFKETFYGASVFMEKVLDSGYTFGIDYVPVDFDIGDGKRTDSDNGDASGEADTGNRQASASLEDLITLYANVPIGGNGVYALAGYHMVDVTTSETLPSSSYGTAEVNGYQVGIGKKGDNFKIEVFYSDFEDIKLTATGGSASHTVEADADAMGLKLSFFY